MEQYINTKNDYRKKFNQIKDCAGTSFYLNRKIELKIDRDELTDLVLGVNPKSSFKKSFNLDGVSYKIDESEGGIILLNTENGIHIPKKGFKNLITLLGELDKNNTSVSGVQNYNGMYASVGPSQFIVYSDNESESKVLDEDRINFPVSRYEALEMNRLVEF